jgi:hypothetical protein
LFGVSSHGIAIHLFSALAAFAFYCMGLPIAILHCGIDTGAVAAMVGGDISGWAVVVRVGYIVSVSILVGRWGEELSMSTSSTSWVVVVVCPECIRL